MRLVTTPPRAPVLRALVRRFVVIDSPAGHAGALVPDVGLALSLRLGGTGSAAGSALPAAALRGLAAGPLPVSHSPGTRLVVAEIDQAHFNNDFKKLTGQTPRAFFARGGAWGR